MKTRKEYRHFVVVPYGPGVTETTEIKTACAEGWTVASAIPMETYVSILLERDVPVEPN